MRSDISPEAQRLLEQHQWFGGNLRPNKDKAFLTLFRDGSGSRVPPNRSVWWEDENLLGWRYADDEATLHTSQQEASSPFMDKYFAVQDTLNERGSRYGDFTSNAQLTQDLKSVMWASDGWVKLNPVQAQALEVIMDKVARILNGDPNYADNWHDIQGYAKLVEERLPKEQGNG